MVLEVDLLFLIMDNDALGQEVENGLHVLFALAPLTKKNTYFFRFKLGYVHLPPQFDRKVAHDHEKSNLSDDLGNEKFFPYFNGVTVFVNLEVNEVGNSPENRERYPVFCQQYGSGVLYSLIGDKSIKMRYYNYLLKKVVHDHLSCEMYPFFKENEASAKSM